MRVLESSKAMPVEPRKQGSLSTFGPGERHSPVEFQVEAIVIDFDVFFWGDDLSIDVTAPKYNCK